MVPITDRNFFSENVLSPPYHCVFFVTNSNRLVVILTRLNTKRVEEVRARLDQSGYQRVEIFVSGGLTLERVKEFVESGCPVDAFGIGTEISSAKPNNFTADIHEIDGKPLAKRGRIPGVQSNPKLQPLF